MERIEKSIFINAPVEKVWDTMLNDETYRTWTAEFNPSSYFEGDWSLGSDMRFLGEGEGGVVGGMLAKITDNQKYEYVSMEHYGIINGDEIDESAQEWVGAKEAYTFESKDGGTELKIEVDVSSEEKDNMSGSWDKALAKLKEICE